MATATHMTPRVSVCIANYNGESLLRDCIGSLVAQSTKEAIEIIVHDDASTDASLRLLRESFPAVIVIESAQNVGFCVSNNRMAARARGEFILLLNNDAALFPDAIETLLQRAQSEPPALWTLPQYDWGDGALVDRGSLLDPTYYTVQNSRPDRDRVATVAAACMFVSRTAWNKLGGFPEWFESIAEDTFLCCAARVQGFDVRVADASGYRHRQGTSFGGAKLLDGKLSSSYRRRRLSERNRLFVLAACTPGFIAWPWLAAAIALLLLEGAVLCAMKRDARLWREVYYGAVRSLIGERRRWMTLRALVQRHRMIALRDYLARFVWWPQKLLLLWRHGVPRIR
jgi:GT2 family glycosyltransferase